MESFEGKVAFITGAASGIGFAIARALGGHGATLVLADIEAGALAAAAGALSDEGMAVETEVLDVRDAIAYSEVAQRVLGRHGTVHLLFNNAGVASHSPVGDSPLVDWRWIMDVNVLGVVYGVELFLGAMRASGETCHIVNTASLAGHSAAPGMGAYCASKFAVVGYSESLRMELSDSRIGVSVLCPAWVQTRIAEARRNHPEDAAEEIGSEGLSEIGRLIAEEGMDVNAVAARVLTGLRDGTFYLFTHPEFWPVVNERLKRIRGDYAAILPRE
jgi:NADP-dependent 3-hydroxy acid dehydrogenase YdfG